MADLNNQVQLQMAITADDQASSVIADLLASFTALREQMLSLADVNPFEGLQEGLEAATGQAQAFADQLKGIADGIATSFAGASQAMASDMAEAQAQAAGSLGDIGDAGKNAATAVQDAMAEAAEQVAEGFNGLATDATTQFDDIQGVATAAANGFKNEWSDAVAQVETDFAALSAKLAAMPPIGGTLAGGSTGAYAGATTQEKYYQALIAAGASPEQAAPETGYAPGGTAEPAAPEGGGGSPRGFLGGVGGDLLGVGMTAWMASMGLNMLAGSAMGPADILSVMQGTNANPAQAEQFMALLGMGGVSASSAPSFISSFSSNLQSLFQHVGGGSLPKDALMLEQLGLNPAIATESPIQAFQTIGAQYQNLLSHGRGSDAQSMLAKLGLSQFAPEFAQFSTVQQGLSGFDLGLSKPQLQQASQQGLTLQESLQKLDMSFTTLASDLSPLVGKIVGGLGDLAQALTKPGSPWEKFTGAQHALGGSLGGAAPVLETGGLLAGIAGAAKAIQGMGGLGPLLSSAADSVAAGVSGFMAGNLAGLGPYIIDAAGAIATAIGEFIVGVVGWPVLIGVAIAGIVVLIAQHWGTIGPFLAQQGQNFGNWVSQWVGQVAAHFTAWVGGTTAAIGKWASGIGGSMAKWATDVGNSIGKWVSGVASKVTGFGTSAEGWVKDMGDSIGKWVTGVGTAIANKASDLVTSAGTLIQEFIDGIGGAIGNLASQIASAAVNLVQSFLNAIMSAIQSAGGWLLNLLGIHPSTGASATSSGTTTSTGASSTLSSSALSSVLSQALQVTGEPSSWLSGLMTIAQHESGGSPTAVNPLSVFYSATAGYENATGLMQMMPSTFNEYAMNGMSDITNALDNAVASIRDIAANYGSPQNTPGLRSLAAGGHYTGYASGGLLTEPVAGMGLSTGAGYLFGEAGPEWLTPAMGSGGAGAMSFNITVNAQGNSALAQSLAQQVSQIIMSQVKMRVGFDMAAG